MESAGTNPTTPRPASIDRLLSVAMDRNPITIVVTDPSGTIQYVNDKFVELTGFTREEAIGQNPRVLKSGLMDPGVYRSLWETISSGRQWSGELLNRKKNGELYWELAVICPVQDEEGRILHYVAMKQDITARKQAEQKQQESEARFASLVDVTSDGIVVTDEAGTIVFCNAAAARMFGYEQGELVGRPVSCLQTPEQAARHEGLLEVGLHEGTSGRTIETVAVHRNGKQTPVELSLASWESGGRRYHGAVIRDISQRLLSDWLAEDCREVLELIGSNRPIDVILQAVCHAAERQLSSGVLVAMLVHGGRLERFSSSAPDWLLGRLEQGGVELARRFRELSEGDEKCYPVSGFDGLGEPDAFASAGLEAFRVTAVYEEDGTPIGVLVLFGQSAEVGQRRLHAAMNQLSRLVSLATEQQKLLHTLVRQARNDPLTGLLNRRAFQQELVSILDRASRAGEQVALLYLDFDHFKRINDSLGHPAGDQVVYRLSQRLREAAGPSALLARLGGDEFAIVLPAVASVEQAIGQAQRILERSRSPIDVFGHELVLTVTIGLAMFPGDARDAQALELAADSAMYRGKRRSRGCVECYSSEMNQQLKDRLELESDLRFAVPAGQMQLHFQPIVDREGCVVAVESLLRWLHPRRGLLLPGTFIPLAEESGLIGELGRFALHGACRQLAAWIERGIRGIEMAVNVAACQFLSPDLVPEVQDLLARFAIPRGRLVLEITESMLIRDMVAAAEQLQRLSEVGVPVAIDDFGTGYSSLAYLQQLPIRQFKIDRAFVAGLANTSGSTLQTAERLRKSTGLVSGIISLGHGLGMQTVAEGIETEIQWQILSRMGCTRMQGFLFGRPQPADELGMLLSGDARLPASSVGPAVGRVA